MAYREPSPRALHVVRYGPFPRPRVTVAILMFGGTVLLAFALLIPLAEPGGEHGPGWLSSLFLAALGVLSAAVAVRAMRAPSSIRIVIEGPELRVVEQWAGIPLRRSVVLTDGLQALRIERGEVRHFADGRATPAGRLLLATADGERPLTGRLLPGTAVHDETARELRRLLLDEENADEPIRIEAAPAPPGRARTSLRTIVLFVAGVFGVATVAQTVATWHADRTQGWLDVECHSHCRFDGMECLPGGAWQTSLDPGDYTIDVLDPDGSWRPVVVHIALGQTTRFVCEAGTDR